MKDKSAGFTESESAPVDIDDAESRGPVPLDNGMSAKEKSKNDESRYRLTKNISSVAAVTAVGVTTAVITLNLKDKAILLPAASILVGFLGIIGLIITLIRFLEPDKNGVSRTTSMLGLTFRIMTYFYGDVFGTGHGKSDETNKQINNLELLTDEEKKEIVNGIQAGLEKNLLLEANRNLLEKLSSSSKKLKIDVFFKDSRDRIITETASQSKRGALNLSIGIVTALIGVGFLVYTVLTSTEQTDLTSFIAHFAPRASVVMLIEVFAYFFLKLYKSSLDEIKYFQNELTNLESKYLAVLLLDDDVTSPVFQSTITSLIGTERNFVLEKGQSTILLERDKIASSTESRVFSLLEKVLPKK